MDENSNGHSYSNQAGGQAQVGFTSIADFLTFVAPDSRVTLCAIWPNGRPLALSFDDYEKAEQWALEKNKAGCNLYWTVNIVREGVGGKPDKSEIQAARGFWGDADPKPGQFCSYAAAREHLLNGTLAEMRTANPTLIVDSGHGLYPLFLLKHPVGLGESRRDEQGNVTLSEEARRYEALNAKVGERFYGPGTFNADRLMRLPFTQNYPSKAKLAKGYPDNPSPARVIECSGIRYAEAEIEALCKSDLEIRLEEFLQGHPKARARWQGDAEGLRDTSGSAFDLSMVSMLKQGGFSYEETKELLRSWPHGSVQARSNRNWARSFQRCWEKVDEPERGEKKDKVIPARLDTLLSQLEDLGHFEFNLFSQRVEVQGEELKSDSQITEYRDLFIKTLNSSVGHVMMYQGIECVARRYAYDPVVDYLESLKWDGIARLATWLADVYSAEQGEYTATVGERMLTSAVARAYKPGCKVRTMVLFTGIQELGKSKSCADLCPNPDWFSDSLPKDLHTREAAEALAGKWIVESAELASFKRSEVEAVKAFLSRNVDNYRAPYARVTESRPRRCILVGTSNNTTPIPYDEEGSRYWPVTAKDYNEDFLLLNRDQLWAEAVHVFKTGKPWWLDTPELKKLAMEVREDFRGDDALTENLRALGLGREITVHEVINKIQGKLNDRALEMRVGTSLRALGYVRRRRGNYSIYERKD